MNFTTSSFERMMKQKPRPQAPGPAKPPRGSACSGCPYWRACAVSAVIQKLSPRPGGGR